jgi:hypothetical protein
VDRHYEEPEHVFHKIPKYHMNTLLGDFNSKVGRVDISKPTRNENLHEISSDNGDRVVNFPHPKIWLSKAQYSHIVTFKNLLGHLLMERLKIKFNVF